MEITLPGPEEVAGWLAEHAAGDGRTGVAVSGTWGRGTGTLNGLALATPDGAGAYLDPATLTEDDERALAGWLADPARPRRCTTPRARSTPWPPVAWSWAG